MIVNATTGIEDLTLLVEQEIHVGASLEDTFEALLEQLGPHNEAEAGRPMPMVLEAWPGGRWYRDLGNDNGHMWGHVQAIKRPTLLEFCGPLMMSLGVASNVQYRLSEDQGGTRISFHHYAVGVIPADFRNAMDGGWHTIIARAKQRAEKR